MNLNPRRLMTPLLLCFGCALAGPALAADDGWYVVGFGGQSSTDVESQSALDEATIAAFADAGFAVVDASSSLDDSDTAFGVTLGYQVNENFAAELSYVDLGSADYNASGTVNGGFGDVPASVGISASAQGPVFSFLGILPIGERFSVYGRLGLTLMDTEGSVSVTIDGVTERLSDSTQRSNGLYGLGGEFSVSQRFGIRLEWTRYAEVGSEDITGETDVDLIALGLRYSFR